MVCFDQQSVVDRLFLVFLCGASLWIRLHFVGKLKTIGNFTIELREKHLLRCRKGFLAAPGSRQTTNVHRSPVVPKTYSKPYRPINIEGSRLFVTVASLGSTWSLPAAPVNVHDVGLRLVARTWLPAGTSWLKERPR